MSHHHQHHHNTSSAGKNWGELGAYLELQAESLSSLLEEVISRFQASLCGLEVRRIVDLGCGPGVSVTALGQAFPEADLIAVDQSQELLAMARSRAARYAMEPRLTTMAANLDEGLGSLSEIDLAWAGMVLHHLATPEKSLREIASALRPGGLFAFSEFGPITRTLPEALGFGEDGFERRQQAAMRATIEAHLAPGAMHIDWAEALSASGLEVLEQRTLFVHQEAPLPEQTRRWLTKELARSAPVLHERLSEQDRATLAILLDGQDSRSIMHRPDVFLDMGRAFFLARKPLTAGSF
jgi:trans-aconitate methyltransferase